MPRTQVPRWGLASTGSAWKTRRPPADFPAFQKPIRNISSKPAVDSEEVTEDTPKLVIRRGGLSTHKYADIREVVFRARTGQMRSVRLS